MKKTPIALLLLLPLLLGGCGLFHASVETSSFSPEDYSYVYTPETTVPGVTSGEEPASLPDATLPTETQPDPTAVITVPTVPQSTAAPTTAAPDERTTAAPAPTEPTAELIPSSSEGEIDLSIQLPEANGTMEVSTDPQNAFIRAVHETRGIDVSLLAAVYAVPESGQNYVFEFTAASERTADSLRRVYLLLADGTIVSVAASNSAERENLSATENWFCMNVLIKNMVFPAVKDRM